MIWLYAAIGVVVLIAAAWLLLRRYLNVLVERRIAVWQNELVARHCGEVENIYRQMRGWRHDYHNHIQTMKACLALDQTQQLGDYLDRLDADLVRIDRVIKTGNVMVDAILNSKISLARAHDISVNAKATVPPQLRIVDVDLCVVLGNLMDNAIEACMKIEDTDKRFIRVYIGMHKEMFYISVSNAMGSGIRRQESGLRNPIYLSTKGNEGHGFGLVRIDRIVEKYAGFVDRQNEEGAFVTEIMLPL